MGVSGYTYSQEELDHWANLHNPKSDVLRSEYMSNNEDEMNAELENISEKATTSLLNGEFDKAIDCFTEVLKKDSEQPFGYIYLGIAYYEKDVHKMAIEKLTKGINLAERYNNHNTSDSTMDILQKRIRKGKFVLPTQKEIDKELTAREIKKNIQSSSVIPEAYIFRADAYFKMGSHKLAIKDYDKAISLGANNPYAYIGLACVYSDKGEFDKTIEYCNTAIELDPEFVEAYTNRGLAYMYKGNNDCAEKDFHKARELNPDFIESVVYSGQVCLNKFEYDDAINYFDKVIAIDNKHIIAFIGRGVAYFEKKEYNKALDDFKEAIYLNPDSAEAHRRRGILFFEKKDMPSAIEDFTKAIKIDKTDPETYTNRGKAYHKNKKFEEAIKDYDRAINLDPKNADAYFSRSITHFIKGLHLATIDCEQALNLKPDLDGSNEERTRFMSHLNQIGNLLENVLINYQYNNR
jgi:tetratricopeptide (TPR) repeat protein